MNILISGGCGFIGLNLIAFLRDQTDINQVRVLDNLSLGKKEYLDEFDVEFIEGDIRDMNVVDQACNGMDAIVHLAADTRVMDSIENPDFNFDVNVNGTYTLLKSARSHSIEHFVLASTGGAIIGQADPPVHEEMVPRPMSPYGASKLMAEGYLSAFSASYGMNTVALRFSNVYGQRSYHKGSVVALIFKQILGSREFTVYGDGSQTRDYIYAADLCSAILRATRFNEGSEVFQLGTGVGTALNEILHLCQEISGIKLDIEYRDFRQGEITHTWTDISKAKRALDFDPVTDLAQGLEQTWKWFQQRSN